MDTDISNKQEKLARKFIAGLFQNHEIEFIKDSETFDK